MDHGILGLGSILGPPFMEPTSPLYHSMLYRGTVYITVRIPQAMGVSGQPL